MNNLMVILVYVLFTFTLQAQEDKTIQTDIFKVVYSEEYQQPIYVEYNIQCPNGTASRKGMNFHGVDNVSTSDNDDYKNNVWDKGHMAPAASFNCDEVTLRKTFSYLNCALQHQGLNRGPWKELERYERRLAKENTLVTVYITIHFNDEIGLLPTGARIPTGFTKVIIINNETIIQFYFPNKDVAGIYWEEFKTN